MTEKTYREIMIITAMARYRFGGIVKACYDEVVDAIHLPTVRKKIESISSLIGEPVMLAMGDIEQTYIPDCENLLEKLNAPSSLQGVWLHPVSSEQAKLIDENQFNLATLFSGASGSIRPRLKLDTEIGFSKESAEKRLASFAKKGLRISADWNNGEILYSPPISYTPLPT